MAETEDALDLGSSPFLGWGFDSPSPHYITKIGDLNVNNKNEIIN